MVVVVVVGSTIEVVVVDSTVVVVGCSVVVVVGGSTVEVVVVTGAAVTVNATVQVTISVPVVTVTSHAPTGASAAMVIFATAWAGEVTRVLLTVMPVQLKDALLTPSTKLVSAPVMVTSRVAP
jgi:hypothetical protein